MKCSSLPVIEMCNVGGESGLWSGPASIALPSLPLPGYRDQRMLLAGLQVSGHHLPGQHDDLVGRGDRAAGLRVRPREGCPLLLLLT
jgi:hypothetical protein